MRFMDRVSEEDNGSLKLRYFKENVEYLENEIRKLNLSKDQVEKLSRRKQEAKIHNLCEQEVVRRILNHDQIHQVQRIKRLLHNLERNKEEISNELKNSNEPLVEVGSVHRTESNSKYCLDVPKITRFPLDKLKLSKEQINTICTISRQIDKMKITKLQMMELSFDKERSNRKDFVERISLVNELIKELKSTKENLTSCQYSHHEIRKLDKAIGQITRVHFVNISSTQAKDWLNSRDKLSHSPAKPAKKKMKKYKIYEEIFPRSDIKLEDRHISLRVAIGSDISEIAQLCNQHTDAIFNVYDLDRLLGSCWLSIVGVNRKGKIVAFMAVNDYPNVPYIPRSGWELWMLNIYQTKEFSPPTARFLHFFAWDEHYLEEDTLQQFIRMVFAQDPFVKFLLFILPPAQKICEPYSTVFEEYLARRNLEKELRSSRALRLAIEPYTLKLYVAYRHRFGPTVSIVNSNKVHNDKVIKNIEVMAPCILKVYGMNFYKCLVASPQKKRFTITAECSNKTEKGMGIMTLTTRINTKLLDEYFDTFPYHGFRIPTKKDTWHKIYLRKHLIQDTKKLTPDSKPIITRDNLEGVKTEKKCKSNKNCRIKTIERHIQKTLLSYDNWNEKMLQEKVAKEEENLKRGEGEATACSQLTDRARMVDMDLRLARSTGMPFTPEEIQQIRNKWTKECKQIGRSSSYVREIAETLELNGFIRNLLKPSGATRQRNTVPKSSSEDEESCVKEKCSDSEANCKARKSERNNLENRLNTENHHTRKIQPYLYLDRLALWKVNGEKKVMRTSIDTRVEYHGKSIAMAIELFIPSYLEHPSCCLRYLKTAFRYQPGKDYCLITVPPHGEELPLLQFFQKVNVRKMNFDCRDLYVCHRLGVMGKHSVREGTMSDLEEMLAMSYLDSHSNEMHQDILSIFLDDSCPPVYLDISSAFNGSFRFHGSAPRCFVLMAASVLVGYAVVEPNYDMEYYRCHYKMEDLVEDSSHSAEGHGNVRHLVIAPLLRHLTRFFLRGIMKLCDWTTLITSFLPPRFHHLFPRYSVIQGLEEWIQVSPRILPQYWKAGLGWRTPGYGKAWHMLEKPPRAVHLMTYQASALSKRMLTCYIVVLGVGDTALSFLEHLIFSGSYRHLGFRYITVISEGGLPMEYPSGFHKPIKAMIPDTSARYDQDYLDRLCLETWIRSIHGLVTFIDRDNKMIHVDGQNKIKYDYLFMFCGSQFLKPIGNLEVKTKPRITDRSLEAAKKARDLPANVFVVNNHLDAYQALTNLTTSFKVLGKNEDSQVVVYGNCVQAFACVSALLKFGISGNRITLVLAREQLCRSTMYIQCPEVMRGFLQTLSDLLISVHFDCSLERWEEEEMYGSTFITSAQFESRYNKVKIRVVAMFAYGLRGISHKASLVCESAGLAYDHQLIIDPDFLTTSDDIYAGGSFTRYSPSIVTDAFNHEFYNSVEIGAEVARKFLQRIEENKKGNGGEREKKEMVILSQPLVVSAELPGSWNYLKITRPGKEDVHTTNRALKGTLLQTGDAVSREGPGFFQILLDEHGVVNDIVCYSTSKIDVKNLVNVYGKHECLLNNLLFKLKGQQISDLFTFFREPWAYAIYHDRFPLLITAIDTLFINKLPYEEASFYDVVAHALDKEKWQKISNKHKNLLEDLFCIFPNLKEKIQEKVESFLESNENVLTTYLTQGRMKYYQSKMENSRVADHFIRERRLRPLVDHMPRYIVPEIRRRREMRDRPVEMLEPVMELGPQDAVSSEGDVTEARSKRSTRQEAVPGPNDNLTEPHHESWCYSSRPSSSTDPFPTGVDMDEEVEISVRPVAQRNIPFLSIPIEEIEFEQAIRRKFKEFKQCLEDEAKKNKEYTE